MLLVNPPRENVVAPGEPEGPDDNFPSEVLYVDFVQVFKSFIFLTTAHLGIEKHTYIQVRSGTTEVILLTYTLCNVVFEEVC